MISVKVWSIAPFHKVLKRLHYPLEVMLTFVMCNVAYPLRLRHIKEMIAKNVVFSLTTPLCNAGQSRWLVNGTGH